MKKYLSYSEIYLWQRDRTEYIERYVKGLPGPTTQPMELGKLIHATIEEPRYPWLRQAKDMKMTNPRIMAVRKIVTKMSSVQPSHREYGMRTSNHEPELFAILDGFDKKERILYEYKTTENPKSWSQWKVDNHLQLSLYAYIFYHNTHQYFSDIQLFVCNTKRGFVKTYHTARGPRDIQETGRLIDRVYNEMKEAGIWDKRVSRKDIDKAKNLQLDLK